MLPSSLTEFHHFPTCRIVADKRANLQGRLPLFAHRRQGGNSTGKTYGSCSGPQLLQSLLRASQALENGLLPLDIKAAEFKGLFASWQKSVVGGGATFHPRGFNVQKGVGTKGFDVFFDEMVSGEPRLQQIMVYHHHMKKILIEMLRKHKLWHFMSCPHNTTVSKLSAKQFLDLFDLYLQDFPTDREQRRHYLEPHMEVSFAFKGRASSKFEAIGEWLSGVGAAAHFGPDRGVEYVGSLPIQSVVLFARHAVSQLLVSIDEGPGDKLSKRQKAALVFALSHGGIIPTGYALSLVRDAKIQWEVKYGTDLITWQLNTTKDVFPTMGKYQFPDDYEAAERYEPVNKQRMN